MHEFIPPHHVILLKALLCSYELNTLDACWIAVDVWSNSSRCRQESVYLSRTWCLYTWSCLDKLIIIRFSINCSTVCSPTVILMLSWEKPLVKPMAPGSISYYICFQSTFIYIFIFSIYIIKIPKIYLSYHIISIISHFRKWPWRDWQPLYRFGCEVLSCLCRNEVTRTWSPTGLIPWFSKTKGNTYATLLQHPFLFKENQHKLKT